MSILADTFVPSWVAVALAVATLAMLAGVVALVRRANRVAERLKSAHPNATADDKKAERRLFVAALIPTLFVIAAVMSISFVGLASFARDDMGWHSWIRFIVPISLDGISITFGFWAFVAVKRGRHPGRSEKIVFIGALISALINFNHGRQEWTGAAGLYLGFLSLASGWMFHELLAQFMDGQDQLPKARRHGTPAFGERWMWAPWSTLLARRAWVVYPPADGIESTPANALHHLAEVLARRAIDRDTSAVRHKVAVAAVNRELTGVAGQPIPPIPTPASLPTLSIQDDQPKRAVPSSSPIPVPAKVPASTPATVPARQKPISGAPLPAQLLATARKAAEEHVTSTGRAISRDELQKVLRLSNATTGDVMRALGQRDAPRQLAGVTAVSPLTGKPLL